MDKRNEGARARLLTLMHYYVMLGLPAVFPVTLLFPPVVFHSTLFLFFILLHLYLAMARSWPDNELYVPRSRSDVIVTEAGRVT